MRRQRRFVVVCLLLIGVFVLFLRNSAPSYSTATSRYSRNSHGQIEINPRQAFAYSAFMNLGNSIDRSAPLSAPSILFLAGSTRAAATLLPLAAELANEIRAHQAPSDFFSPYVHFVFMGPYSVDLDFLVQSHEIDLRMHGNLLKVHDGRARLNSRTQFLTPKDEAGEDGLKPESLAMYDISQATIRVAMETTVRHMRPFVTVWSRQLESSSRFGDAIASLLGPPTSKLAPIDLPSQDIENLRWLSLLGLEGLKSWSRHEFDIVIPVTSHIGSVVRLLSQIAAANYYNFFPRPRITIYLPPGPVDPNLVNFIERTLHYPSNQIILQSVPISPIVLRQQTTREALYSYLLRSYVPTSRKAHVILLADTVELSPMWFHWTVYHTLRYSPEVVDSLNPGLPTPFAGLSLCPVTISFTEEELANFDSEEPYMFTQSRADLACAVYFASHFRTMQAYLAEQVKNELVRMIPSPPEIRHVLNRASSAKLDAYELLLPLFFRGYLLLAMKPEITQLIGSPALNGRTILSSRSGSVKERSAESTYSLLTMSVYDALVDLKRPSVTGQDEGFQESWVNIGVYPDIPVFDATSQKYIAPDRGINSSTLWSVRERGRKYAEQVSPKCNVAVSIQLSDEDAMFYGVSNDAEAVRDRIDVDRLEDPVGVKSEDNWSDVFCAAENEQVRVESLEKSGPRAKSLEEERRLRKAERKVVNAADPKQNLKPVKSAFTKAAFLTTSSMISSIPRSTSTTPAQ
ncbi:uncharacterized protein V1516DRAFT_668954 [Lipomyces oligophaga]|uniref:uncharacterized protein n=1 Tax=Lipomyces oligophaga TaxID=45792 RepID=UPI0034CDD133